MTLAWMDAARYGDSSVMHADGPRTMWPWRDWVLNAYNSNMSFKDFTIEQLAGDLLPNATVAQKVATGFNRNHPTSDEGGAFPEELRVEYIVDRVKTTANVWLGLSMECAQCHDHKYDPISQEEYFSFFAFYNNNKDPGMQSRKGNQAPIVKIQDPAYHEAMKEIAEERKALNTKLEARKKAAAKDVEKWIATREKEIAKEDSDNEAASFPGLILHLPLMEAQGQPITETVSGATGKLEGKHETITDKDRTGINLANGTIDFPGLAQDIDFNRPFTFSAWVKHPGGSGAIFSRMRAGDPYTGFDFWSQDERPGVHLVNSWKSNALKVYTKKRLKKNQWQHVVITYNGSMKAGGIAIYIDGKREKLEIEVDALSASLKNDVPFRVGGRTGGSRYKGGLSDLRILDRVVSEGEIDALKQGRDVIKDILTKPAEERSGVEMNLLTSTYLETLDKTTIELKKQLAELSKREGETKTKYPEVTSMIMADNPNMRATYILDRGLYDSPKKEKQIFPATPAFLPSTPEDAPGNRLTLANWIMQDNHPLTARVTVNRYWTMLFGNGIVSSVMDFGNQGTRPSHPELLDWLAVDFRESGWDVKRMIKMMVMSATYRQSARFTPDSKTKDPNNVLLSRGTRFRLQGEFIRDQALSVGGILVNEVGGISVKPYQPKDIWNEVSLDKKLRYKQDSGDKLFRRSMYTYWKRSAPAPNMMIFDAPTRETCVVKRPRTNTPLQALVTLNDVHFVEASRMFAQRIMKEGGDNFERRISMAYLLALSRKPTGEELAICKDVFEKQMASFSQDVDQAVKYLAQGAAGFDESLDPAELASYTVIANMILNLDETLTRG